MKKATWSEKKTNLYENQCNKQFVFKGKSGILAFIWKKKKSGLKKNWQQREQKKYVFFYNLWLMAKFVDIFDSGCCSGNP